MSSTTSRLWRIAGALLIAHIVLLFTGVAFERSPVLGDKPSAISDALVSSPLTRVFAGGYVEYLSFLVFLAGAVLLARLVRGSGETSGWLASLAGSSAVAYVGVTVATGFAAGAAAQYDGHHGAPLSTITTVVDIRNFAFFLSIGLLGVFTLAVCGAAHVTQTLPRWAVYSGYALGAASILSVAGARTGAIDFVNLIWFAWLLAVGVVALRHSRHSRVPMGAPQPATV